MVLHRITQNLTLSIPVLILLFHFSPFYLHGQEIDSLINVVNNSKGEVKIESLKKLSDAVLESSPQLSIAYLKQAVNEAEKINNSKLKISTLIYLASLFSDQNQPDSALVYYEIAKAYATESSDFHNLAAINHKIGVVYYIQSNNIESEKCYKKALFYSNQDSDTILNIDILISMGYMYDGWGKFDTAIVYMERAFAKSEQAGFKKGIARTSIAMGNLYYGIDNQEKALEYYEKTLEIARELDNKMGIGISLTNVASVYNNLGKNDEAMKAILEAIEVLKETQAYSLLANSYSNLALIQSENGFFEKAFINLEKSMELFKSYGSKNDIAISMFSHSNVYSTAKMYSRSNLYLDSALSIANEAEFALMQQKVYKAYANNFQKMGKYQDALKNLEKHYEIKDSIQSEKMQKQLLDFEVKYETMQKEKEIEVLQKDKALNDALLNKRRIERNAFLTALIFVVILIVILIRTRKREKQLTRQKLKLFEQNKQIAEIELEKNRLKKEELENELEFQSKQLTTHALNMLQKNKLLQSLKEDINSIKGKAKDELKPELRNINLQITKNLRGEKDWEVFKMYFEQVNKEFYSELKIINPELTSGDLRLCALIKLNLNIKESAAVLNLSPVSIKSARYRLRKKLNLDAGVDLYDFISGIES